MQEDKPVRIDSFTWRYRGRKEPAIQSLSLEISQGDFVVIMGPSGAGKSTLAISLNGLIPHFYRGKMEGNIFIFGKSTRDSRVGELARYVGLVFQDFEAQLFSTNVALEVAFGPENFCVPPDEIGLRVRESLAKVGLQGFEERRPATLSGGQKQRLAIASVLALQPKILCMDEPTTDLDPIGKEGVFKIARSLEQEEDVTLIVIEHETEEALNADRIVLMRDGQVVADHPAKDMLRKVALMEECGVMPLQVPQFFSVMGVPEMELPLTPEEGVQEFRRRGYKVDEVSYTKLVEEEKSRMESNHEVIIEVRNLSHMYPGRVLALEDISLNVRKGEFLAILGQNGSGKTTLVKHFNGLLYPTSGSVRVNGEETRKLGIRTLGQHIGYVFQNPDHQIFSDKVYDEVAFGLRLRHTPEGEIKQRVADALKAVDLEGYEDADPFSLTKGERQRVAVASVLAGNPEVLILDEPTTGLDYSQQRSMMELVKRLNESGSTIIVVTHSMWLVAEYADRVVVMKDGRVYLSGTVREVFSREEELRDAALKPPQIVSMSNLLGYTVRSVEELVHVTKENI